MHNTSKRGYKYNTRDNKQAEGYSKMCADNRVTVKDRDMLMLVVYGSFDVLHKKFMYTSWIVKHHPNDKSYTKRVTVLGKVGKRRLALIKGVIRA